MSSLLGKRYYESAETAAASDEEPEEDYLSDKFLAEIEAKEKQSKQSGVKTYTQLRKEAQKRKEERGYIKPRAEREREAREEGLKRNLMMPSTSSTSTNGSTWKTGSTSESAPGSDADDLPPPTHGGNKALSMMMKMGFKPGEALGRKIIDSKGKGRATQVTEDESDNEEEDSFAGIGAKGGIGSRKKATTTVKEPLNEDFISINDLSDGEPDATASDAAQTKRKVHSHRIDPIEIQMRSGRGGLGVEEAKRRKLAAAASKEKQSESVDDYRSRARSNHSERRAEGQLKSVRETCLALDEREGIKSNYMWLDPLEEYHKEREKALGARSRFRIKEREGLGGEFDEDNEYGDDQAISSLRNGKRDNLHEEILLDSDEEDIDTEEAEKREQAKNEFLRRSAVDRLRVTLDYLRRRHHYCFWCGTAYSSAEELASECPGVDEDDH